MAANRGTFEVEEARTPAEPKPQPGLGNLSLQAQIGIGVGILVFGVLLGALIIPGKGGGKKESGGDGGGSGGGGFPVEGVPIRYSSHGGAPFHVAFWLEHSEKSAVVEKHGDWFDGASASSLTDEDFKQKVTEKLKSFVPEKLDGVKVDFVDMKAIDKHGWWGWMAAGSFGEVSGAADFTLPEETQEVKAALESVSASLNGLNMGGLAPIVEMATMDKLQTRYIRELRGKIKGTLGDETKFEVAVLPNISDVGAFTDAIDEAKYQHDLVFHVDVKDKSKVCAASKLENCDDMRTTTYVEQLTELCQKIVREQLKSTSMVQEKNCAVAFGDEGEADLGSDSWKTSFWLTDGLSCVFKDGSDPLKDISVALKKVEDKTKVPLGDILRSLQDHQWEQYHVPEMDGGIKQHLESEVGASVDQVDVPTMKAIRKWEEHGRCCVADNKEKFWVQLNLLDAGDDESTEGLNDADLEMLSMAGLCPKVDAGKACSGAGATTNYANPLECSDGKLSEDIKNVAKEIKQKCAPPKTA